MDRGWWIICGVLFVIGFFNLGLALSVLRSRGRQEGFFSGSLSDMLNPWKEEDKALQTLHESVQALTKSEVSTPDEASDG